MELVSAPHDWVRCVFFWQNLVDASTGTGGSYDPTREKFQTRAAKSSKLPSFSRENGGAEDSETRNKRASKLYRHFTLSPWNPGTNIYFNSREFCLILKVTFLLKRSKAGRAGRLSHSHTMYNVHYNYTDTTKILTKIIISNSLIMVSLNTTKIFNLRWRVKVVKEFSKINVKKAKLRLESESSKLR